MRKNPRRTAEPFSGGHARREGSDRRQTRWGTTKLTDAHSTALGSPGLALTSSVWTWSPRAAALLLSAVLSVTRFRVIIAALL